MDKIDALIEYFNTYPKIYQWIYFNTVPVMVDSTSIVTDDDVFLEDYIDGSQKRAYIFNILYAKEYDTGTSDTNTEAIKEASNLIGWVKSNDAENIYPAFCYPVLGIEPIRLVPSMSIDEDGSLSIYNMPFRIIYMNESEEIRDGQ